MASSFSERESFRFRVVQSASDCKKFHSCKSAAACVARNLKTSEQLVRRWVKRELQGEGLRDRPRSGAPLKLSEDAIRRAKALLLASNTGSTLRKVARKLAEEGHCSAVVSRGTVAKAVKGGKGALQSCHVSSVPMLSEEQMQKRVAFATANRSTRWKKVMFTDSKYFYLTQLAGRKGPKRWVLAGSKPVQAVVKFPSKVHVYAGVSFYGKTKLHFATGTTGLRSVFSKTQRGVGAEEYQAIVKETLLPEARRFLAGIQFGTGFSNKMVRLHTRLAVLGTLWHMKGSMCFRAGRLTRPISVGLRTFGLDRAAAAKAFIFYAYGAKSGAAGRMGANAIGGFASKLQQHAR